MKQKIFKNPTTNKLQENLHQKNYQTYNLQQIGLQPSINPNCFTT